MRRLQELEGSIPSSRRPIRPRSASAASRAKASSRCGTARPCSASTTPSTKAELRDFDRRVRELLGGDEIPLRRRAQDGRPLHGGALPQRRVHAGGDARRRRIGEEVTENARTIRSLPLRVKTDLAGVRGPRRNRDEPPRVRAAERRARREGAFPVRQSAQRRGRIAARAGAADHGLAPPGILTPISC